ncbi:MAG: hypothetical protein H0T56_11670 [Pseudaminobacter sp.]|nr:hypothetical protein [Pseudaminobacter sp.]
MTARHDIGGSRLHADGGCQQQRKTDPPHGNLTALYGWRYDGLLVELSTSRCGGPTNAANVAIGGKHPKTGMTKNGRSAKGKYGNSG